MLVPVKTTCHVRPRADPTMSDRDDSTGKKTNKRVRARQAGNAENMMIPHGAGDRMEVNGTSKSTGRLSRATEDQVSQGASSSMMANCAATRTPARMKAQQPTPRAN